MRRSLLGPVGPWVVRWLCAWELVALLPGSPLPTVTATVRRHPWFGVLLLCLLGHHWFVEAVEVIEAFSDAVDEVLSPDKGG